MAGIGRTGDVDVAVVGAGLAGLTAAVALAAARVGTALVGRHSRQDRRSTALLVGSVAALDALGVWAGCAAHAAPLRRLRIIDDTGRLIRSPEVVFDASEIGLAAFGHCIENRHLLAALEARTRDLPALFRVEHDAQAIKIGARQVDIRFDGGAVSARLAIGADGRRSLCRVAAGIAADERKYPQAALTFTVRHTRPHNDISTEFHRATGPFTLVPLPGRRSSIVWVLDTATAAKLAALDDAALAVEAERTSHSILGGFAIEGGRSVFPLAFATARQFARNRVALIGEAAHLVPPIGAQGLNLGLRDAATLAELVVAACRNGADVGGAELLRRYDAARRADVDSRAFAIDLLNRSLLSDFLPLQGVRGLGLYLIGRIGPLRRALMREGVQPTAAAPRLMRGERL
ncbi:MAG TPA: UbiH/UbiF family hydroxylase [Xanthobacteraceae bacterium]|nr:UbiH/UbiF family hydroxylase [Xanthobacteraceae bacterium]